MQKLRQNFAYATELRASAPSSVLGAQVYPHPIDDAETWCKLSDQRRVIAAWAALVRFSSTNTRSITSRPHASAVTAAKTFCAACS